MRRGRFLLRRSQAPSIGMNDRFVLMISAKPWWEFLQSELPTFSKLAYAALGFWVSLCTNSARFPYRIALSTTYHINCFIASIIFYETDRLTQPPVALMQWQNEINEYTDGKLRVLIHHNSNPKVKNLKVKDLRGFDVIMISYSGLESVYRKESKGWKRDDGLIKENSKIHAIHYHRLILDEAHNIKTRTTGGTNKYPMDDILLLIQLQLPKLASHSRQITSGAFLVHPCKMYFPMIGIPERALFFTSGHWLTFTSASGSSFHFFASSKLRLLHAIFARSANVQSSIGHRTKLKNARRAIILALTTSRFSIRSC